MFVPIKGFPSSLFIIVAATAFLLCASPNQALSAQTPGAFSATGSMTEARTVFTATRLRNGKVLLVGGNSSASTTAEIYDPSTGTFSSTGSPIAPRSGQTATLLRNGDVLITGGSSSQTAELYNPATGTFSATGQELETNNVFGMGSALLPDGTVLIIGGGCGQTGSGCSVPEIYDPKSGTFKTPPGTFDGQCEGNDGDDAVTLLNNGEVLLTGGQGTQGNTDQPAPTLNCSEIYDPSGGPAFTAPNMTAARAGHSSTLMQDGRVLIAGGYLYTEGSVGPVQGVHGSAEIYDPKTNTFTATGPLLDSRFYHAATLLPNGLVLVAGGTNSNQVNPSNALPSAELYNPASGTFSSTGSMIAGRFHQDAVFLSNALTLEAGGENASDAALSSAELYSPAGAVNFGAPQRGDTVAGTVTIGTEISKGVEWTDLYIDGQYLTSGPPFTFNWNSASVANGPHVISAKAFNGTGVVGSAAIGVNVANGPVALMWPPTGATVSHRVGIGAQINSSSVEWINFYIDGGWIASGPPFTTYWDSSKVANGTHTILTRAYGSSGQLGSDSVTVNVSN